QFWNYTASDISLRSMSYVMYNLGIPQSMDMMINNGPNIRASFDEYGYYKEFIVSYSETRYEHYRFNKSKFYGIQEHKYGSTKKIEVDNEEYFKHYSSELYPKLEGHLITHKIPFEGHRSFDTHVSYHILDGPISQNYIKDWITLGKLDGIRFTDDTAWYKTDIFQLIDTKDFSDKKEYLLDEISDIDIFRIKPLCAIIFGYIGIFEEIIYLNNGFKDIKQEIPSGIKEYINHIRIMTGVI
ncbi:MAG: hypothetical protein Solumvirus6_1, partial [Solumvirus sp.]